MNNSENIQVLVCDDSMTNVLILKSLLESELGVQVQKETDPRNVMSALEQHEFDLLLLDIEMPHLNGFQVMQKVRNLFNMDELPIAILTGHTDAETRNKALAEGANDYINKPFDQTEVTLRAKNLIKLRQSYKVQKNYSKELEDKVEQRTKELNVATETLIYQLAMAGAVRDKETGKHVIRVGKYARLFAEKLDLPAEICFMIEKTAPMHDIGKIGIPDAILLKEGKLDEQEREIMNSHPQLGAKILGEHPSMLVKMAANIALSHHERWDGNGYPFGLKGESIPVEGRITSLSDVFDALTTIRSYKEAWKVEEVINYIKEQSGISFDPALVDIFVNNTQDFLNIRQAYLDE